MKDFFKAPKTKTVLWTLCAILGILVIFGLGIVVGYRKAIFASTFGENYYHNFYGGPTGPMGKSVMGIVTIGPIMPHGVSGEVIDVGSGTIVVRDFNGNEASIIIASNTPIREMNQDISSDQITAGNYATIIGEPDPDGQVNARFIRVFQSSPTHQ